jgi:hypothetical protein
VSDPPSNLNPYKPPASEVDAPDTRSVGASPGLLFSPTQIAVATLFGWALGGAIFLANYRKRGRTWAANSAGLLGLMATAGQFALMWELPGSYFPLMVNVLLAPTVFGIAVVLQGGVYRKHIQAGGAHASWWRLGAIVAALVAARWTVYAIWPIFPIRLF